MSRLRLLGLIAWAGGIAAAAGMLPATPAAAHRAERLPEHVFAPYFETFTPDSPAQLSRQSRARFLTLAFLQAPAKGSCEIDWNGDATTPVALTTYGADIARIRAAERCQGQGR